MIGLCFGGYLAIYPAVTADFFGTKHLGVNYGWMFTAYGAGGIAGPYLAARLMRVSAHMDYQAEVGGEMLIRTIEVGHYRPAFLVAGIACVLAAGLACLLKKPVVAAG